jgi:aryl-alcohol dehydrogenase-like predicted oxidoreductase
MYGKRYGEEWMFDTSRRFNRFSVEHGYHPVSLAVAWVSHHPAVTAPILGARHVDQLEDALRSVDIPMSPELYADICRLTPPPPSATDRSEEIVQVQEKEAQRIK